MIIILEMRYVDDYIALWKPMAAISPYKASTIGIALMSKLRDRYPLPLEEDTGSNFIGLVVGSGVVVTLYPCPNEMFGYDESFNFPSYLDFRSFLPISCCIPT